MPSKYRIKQEIIERNYELEKVLGIEDIIIYAYIRNNIDLRITCEIKARGILESYSFECNIYDNEDDLIATSKNEYYGGPGFVSREINNKSFFNGIPVSFKINIPRNSNIKKIRIVPKRK